MKYFDQYNREWVSASNGDTTRGVMLRHECGMVIHASAYAYGRMIKYPDYPMYTCLKCGKPVTFNTSNAEHIRPAFRRVKRVKV